jgi:hypothetical protein
MTDVTESDRGSADCSGYVGSSGSNYYRLCANFARVVTIPGITDWSAGGGRLGDL